MLKLLVFFSLLLLNTSPVFARRVIRAAANADRTGSYIIKLADSVDHEQFNAAVASVASLVSNQTVYERVEGEAAKIFSMKITHEEAEKVKTLENVEYVEEETFARSSQSCSGLSWGLDRLDQVSRTLNCRFTITDKGAGSDIYIIDTGINYNHVEFENRAKYSGYDPVDNYYRLRPRVPQRGKDCNGHGTHVASLAAGRTRGSAPKATIYSVRALDCEGFAPYSVIIDGINSAVQKIRANRRPAVISMSLGGGISQSTDDAVRRAHSMNITVVVAAGNEEDDACFYSPARSSYAVTVGGTARGDGLYTYTNGGNCVDIFAPGQSIPGADYRCNNCTITFSGTSMATPFVSGVVAILLQRQPRLTPQQVKQRLISDSLKDVINFSIYSSRLRNASPNRLLHITNPPTTAPPTTAPPTTAPQTTVPPTTATTAPPTTAPPTTVPPTTPPTIIEPITVTPPTMPSNCDLANMFDVYRKDMSEEMRHLIVQAMNYMAFVLKRRCDNDTSTLNIPRNIVSMGMRKDSPADSCQVLHSYKPYLQSGLYWIQKSQQPPVQVYCDMEKKFEENDPQGWTRVANLNMSATNAICPENLRLVNESMKLSCGRGNFEPGCSSAFFSTQGVRYSKVCGRVRGYQYASPNAFYHYTYNRSLTIDDNYVDGVVLTHNSPTGRKHIWTFAAALDEIERSRQFACPCTFPNSNATFIIPPFVGNDYSCETASRGIFQYDRFYHEDPLWDSAGCDHTSTCCNDGPTFCKTLPLSTTEDIELRVCSNEVRSNEDTPIDLVELYIQ